MYIFFKVCEKNRGDLRARSHLRAEIFSPYPKQKPPAQALVPVGFTFCCSSSKTKVWARILWYGAFGGGQWPTFSESTQYQEEQKWLYPLILRFPPKNTLHRNNSNYKMFSIQGCLSQHYLFNVKITGNNLTSQQIDHRVSAKRSLASITYMVLYGQVRWVE